MARNTVIKTPRIAFDQNLYGMVLLKIWRFSDSAN